ncbi:MAG: 4-alpha-glucanotransferase [Bacteroidales bacterium]
MHPKNIDFHSIVYTGTHDNNTLKGWYKREIDETIRGLLTVFHGKRITLKNVHREMIRTAFASKAMLTIIPLQDWLGLDEESRMNYPSTTNGNWQWKIKRRTPSAKLARRIKRITKAFSRQNYAHFAPELNDSAN